MTESAYLHARLRNLQTDLRFYLEEYKKYTPQALLESSELVNYLGEVKMMFHTETESDRAWMVRYSSGQYLARVNEIRRILSKEHLPTLLYWQGRHQKEKDGI